ncbi:HIRAN domain-containing protein [Novosphingobium sp. RL4]|uniref:HIRAN domain-containing protein n=1 Tax=Novosphingobium sp. RL4 TaxID=3109595 RepID=UPI002D772313|nr:HIRAN domain-containing protein [Novosphingobium sp. RL4]WRT91885.1 HIRAN domain-containing protein [Novosphingobium sp. RL4]
MGADYPNKGKAPGRRFELALCAPGDPLELRPEPENPADEHAIAVYSERGVQLGYISSQRAVRVAQLIRQGHTTTAIFQEATRFGAFARVSFDGAVPALPQPVCVGEEPNGAFDPEPDWYPDEVWPD